MTAVRRLPDVLVVDDDQDVRASLERGLRLSGFGVRLAADGDSALAMIRERSPDLVVLDVTMPGLDGVAVVRRLRGRGDDVPVCLLSARTAVGDRVVGLEAGADDYLVKPFALDELVARLRAMLRRRGDRRDDGDQVVSAGPLQINPAGRTTRWAGTDVPLTKREFELLHVLAVNAGIVLSRDRLLDLVWGYDFETDTNVVDVFVGYLRRKLELAGAPRVVHTVRGVGFVLRVSG